MQKQKGFTIRTTPNPVEPVVIKVHGKLDLNSATELSLTALNTFMLEVYKDIMSGKEKDAPEISEEEKDKTVRAAIYDKVVYSFSMMVNTFFPEAAELRAKEDGFDEFIKQQLVKEEEQE